MAPRPAQVLASLCLAFVLVSLLQPGCGAGGHVRGSGGGGGHAGSGGVAGAGGSTGTAILAGSGGAPQGALTISPQNPTLDVTLVDGVVTSVKLGAVVENPLTFTATENGAAVAATWSINRGELGTLVATTGAFTPSANLAGTAKVTATFGASQASTTLTINLHATQNGAPASEPPSGVGGAPLGGAVPVNVQSQLSTTGQTPPVSAVDLGWLYPYDQTVWPRGVQAPLLQWQTSHASVTAVYVHLAEAGFDFQGVYDLTSTTAQNQPIEATAWQQALNSNGGDKLHVDLKIYAGGQVYGPVSEDWIIAPGLLTGTVYYNSYNSQIPAKPANAPAGAYGAVLAIRPGAASPTVAIASTSSACHVCHTVSADGSTIVMQGPSYKNQDPPTLDRTTVFSLQTQQQTAYYADGTTNQDKFDWAGVYPDGSMAVANSGDGFHAYTGNSDLFKVADGTTIPSTGFEGVVTQAVTPSFSPDGRHLAFSFLGGPGTASVQPSPLRTLALLDFDCGAPTGSVTCSGQTAAFGNLRLLDTETTRYVGWPSFLPDSSAVVFQSTYKATTSGGSNLYTWGGAEADIWYVPVPAAGAAAPTPMPLYALNGTDATGKSYLPTVPSTHDIESSLNRPIDTVLNFEPTVNPIASGGYFWVVFTSRRAYGNVLTGDPWADENDGTPQPFTKKLWVAAVDINPKPGQDPSHPAFYLPGQELLAGNMRGFWVVDPCKADGQGCQTGNECCGGYCQQSGDGGALVCSSTTSMGCSQELEKCTTSADCCAGANLSCIDGHCALVPLP